MEHLTAAYRRTAFIAGAMTATLPVYVVFVAVFRQMSDSFDGIAPAESRTILTDVLFLISLATFFLAWRIRSRTFRSTRLHHGIRWNATTTAGGKKDLCQLLTTTTLVTLALSESIAVYGLAGFFVMGDSRIFYILLTVSAIAFTLWFPRYGQWQDWMKRQLAGTGDTGFDE